MANQPPVQDLLSSVDFTGNPNLDATELNLALSSLLGNSAGDGIAAIGFNLYTVDTAANTPNVPNPGNAGAGKWIKYLWNRIPFAGSTDKTVIVYSWNPDQPNNATYLRWVTTRTDISALQVQVDSNTVDIDSAVITANQASADASNALQQASEANTNATTALNTATTANATATTAATDATTALNTSVAAQTAATTAQTNAAQANTNATAASNAVATIQPVIANAWATFNWTGSAIQLDAKYNVAPITRLGVGKYQVPFITPFNAATNMVVLVTAKSENDAFPTFGSVSFSDTKLTTSVIISFFKYGVGVIDPQEAYIAVFGPLGGS